MGLVSVSPMKASGSQAFITLFSHACYRRSAFHRQQKDCHAKDSFSALDGRIVIAGKA